MFKVIKAAAEKIGYSELHQRLNAAGHETSLDSLKNLVKKKSNVKMSVAMHKVLREVLGKNEFEKLTAIH